ncbi:MAG: hypothetical protein UU10_C0033G0009 [Parcubacteria group bacterium GW2011_GWF1_40_6]|nr:MAG: hypothetical protein UU10_C0033G0009 [Parcubacteria group bacterium GW2011_GWF1_40_6]
MKNNLQKILLIVSLALVIVFCFAFIFLYKKINENNQKAEENAIAWMEGERRRENITSLDRAFEEIFENKTLLERHFAKSSDVVPFLDTLEGLAPKAGVEMEVNSVNIKDDNTVLSIDIRVNGNFGAVYKFLSLLENSPYELDFSSIDMSKLKTGDSIDKTVEESKWDAVFRIQLLSFIP